MNIRCGGVLLLLSLCAMPYAARADEQVLEQVVVRNRLYSTAHRFELSPAVGFTVVNRLTDHYNFTLGAAYNVSDTLAFELRGGYALSGHTGLADDVSDKLISSSLKETDEFSDLWEMKGNGALGVRWAPVYAKISLLAELPVHFQAYLWAGGGGGTFHQRSIIYCTHTAEGHCTDSKEEDKATWLASVAFGMRFFTHQKGGIVLEARDYSFPDSYLVKINRQVALAGGQTGTPSPNPGITHLVLVDLGYSFIF